MTGFWEVFSAVLPVFCLVALGVGLRRLQWLTVQADHGLMQLVVQVLTPCLIIDNILDNNSLRQVENVFLPPLTGFAGIALGLAVATLASCWIGTATRSVRRTFICATGHQNYGYAALPLVILLFPGDTTGVLFVHNIGVDIAMWSLGLIALGHAGFREWRRLLNAPIIAIVGSLLLNAFDGGRWIPDFLRTTIRMLGLCCFPLGIILIGATMADTGRQLREPGGQRLMWIACAVRCLILPASILAIARILPLSTELKRVVVVQAAMPAAAFPIVLARHFGGDVVTAVRVVVSTSAVGLLTIPIWIKIGLWWMDLPVGEEGP